MSRILIIGGTGYMGKHMVGGSVRLGHPTYALVRPSTVDATGQRARLLQSFLSSGVTLIYGDLSDQETLVEAVKRVDVVISAVGHKSHHQLMCQANIVDAIKLAGNIKRYIPSEFGYDVASVQVVEPARTPLSIKAQHRKFIQKDCIPYTIVCCNFAANYYFLSRIGQVEADGPPMDSNDKIVILGDGNAKVVFVDEEDIATYTIKAADDPRTLNKIIHMRPPTNIFSHNELISLWEKKTGKCFEKVHVPEEYVLQKIQESEPPLDFVYAIAHAAFIKGQMMNYKCDNSLYAEATQLYPEVNYTKVDDLLNCLLHQL